MKTPREILLERHQAAESKLDEIRKTAVASVDDRRINSPAITDRGYHWREFLFSLRWHLAGMSAVWLVIALLNLNAGHSANLAAAMPRAKDSVGANHSGLAARKSPGTFGDDSTVRIARCQTGKIISVPTAKRTA